MKIHKIIFLITFLSLIINYKFCLAERADREKSVQIMSDKGTVDDSKRISTFNGKVLLTQGTLTIRSDKLVVSEDENGYFHGTATGHPASFGQKQEGIDKYVTGYGDRIEYNAQKETVNIYGNARIKSQQDEVIGDHIFYSSKSEIYKVDSNSRKPSSDSDTSQVHVIIQPKNSDENSKLIPAK